MKLILHTLYVIYIITAFMIAGASIAAMCSDIITYLRNKTLENKPDKWTMFVYVFIIIGEVSGLILLWCRKMF